MDATIWYRRGLAFSTQEDKTVLEEASLCLEKATSLDDAFFDAWFVWGTVLMRRVTNPAESTFYLQAEEKFLKAESLLANPELHKEFTRQFGLLYFMMVEIQARRSTCIRQYSATEKPKKSNLTGLISTTTLPMPLWSSHCSSITTRCSLKRLSSDLYSLDIEEISPEKSREIAIRSAIWVPAISISLSCITNRLSSNKQKSALSML